MLDDFLQTVGIIVGIGFIVTIVVLLWWRSNSILEGWASDHGFQIIGQEYRTMFRGPFFWTTSKSQTIYRVTVRDRNGRVLTGWVRCGGYFFGLFSDKVEVRWD